jgi:trehalose 2-sulfotransferase
MRVGPPRQSYILWFSQRVGSTLLAQTLEDTAIAGRPREWLNVPGDVVAKYGVANAGELRDVLWREATTDNGVLGLKYGMAAGSHARLTEIMAGVLPVPSPRSAVWQAFFPNCRHIFLTRRNKVRLAVSWWRAIKSNEWHRIRQPGPDDAAIRPRPDLRDQYDYDAIEHLLVESNLREAAMQEEFDAWGIVPHTVVYEDMIAAYATTVRAVLEAIDAPARDHIEIPPPAHDKIADAIAEDWVQRFRRERQATWRTLAW